MVIKIEVWGYSSAGRALAWHARGQRFDPAYLHQSSKTIKVDCNKSCDSELFCSNILFVLNAVQFLGPHRLEA